MKDDNLAVLPFWKRNATNEERFMELAHEARVHPEKFTKWVVVYCEDNDERFKTRWTCGKETRTSDCLAVLSAGALIIFDDTRQ